MRLGKVTRKAISIVLLAAMASSSLSQTGALAAWQGDLFELVTSYPETEQGNPQKTEAENSAPDEEAQSEGSESAENEEAEAESNSGVSENSEAANASSGTSQNVSSVSGGSGEYSSAGDTGYDDTALTTVEDENPLTAGNRLSSFISLDKQAIGFTKVGDVVSVTATLADGVEDKVVWRVADPTVLLVKSQEDNAGESTAQIEWIGGEGTTKFFAGLESDPDEYTEGTAMLFDSASSAETSDEGESDEAKELKTEFESPEVEEFLREMYKEGLSQENSDYDLSMLSDESTEKTYSGVKTDSEADTAAQTGNSELELFDTEKYLPLLGNDELFDDRVSSYLNDTTDETAEKVAEESTSDKSNEDSAGDIALPASTSSDSTSLYNTSSTNSSSEEKVVKETVQETNVQNVSTETTTTETVKTEIVTSETTYETVTSEVEKQIPHEVVNEREQVIETEVINEDGDMETVTETIMVPTVETTYETVTETVEEQIPQTEYTVRETTTTETTTTQTVTDENGTVISSEVVSTDTATSSRDYVTTDEVAEGTSTSVSTSTDQSTVTEVTEKEVVKTYTASADTSVSLMDLAETYEDTENSDTEVYTIGTGEAEIDNDPEITEGLSEEELLSPVTGKDNLDAVITEEEDEEVTVQKSQKAQSLSTTSSKLVTTYSLSASPPITLMSTVTDLNDKVSTIEGIYTIELRKGGYRNLNTILSSRTLEDGVTSIIAGTNISGQNITDTAIATIDSGTQLNQVNIRGVSEGRTTMTAMIGGNRMVFNVEVYGDDTKDTAVPQVVSNKDFTLALKSDGTVWGWGLNNSGQLANYVVTGDRQNYPVKIERKVNGVLTPLKNIKHIAVGETHSLAVTSEGKVYAWGLNKNGMLGNGTTTASTNPMYVKASDGTDLTGIKYVAAGNSTSFAITEYGDVYAWGMSFSGQLGTGAYAGANDIKPDGSRASDQLRATKITTEYDGSESGSGTFTGIIKVSGSYYHTLALKYDGSVYVFGQNYEGSYNATGYLTGGENTYSTTTIIPRPLNITGDFSRYSLDSMYALDIAAGGDTELSTSDSGGSSSGQAPKFHSLVIMRSIYITAGINTILTS